MSVSTEGQAMKLEELINKAGDMKVLPSVARKVMEMVEREDVSGSQLSDVIAKDQALSAHLLKAANSALFGLPREITTVLMAVNVLGFKNTRDMTIMAATRRVYKRFGITEKMLWTHSVSAAIGAKTIAGHYAPFVRDDAFICALLHDVGKVILNNECPELFSQVMMRTYNEGESFVRAETELFGYTHTEVGSLITGKWNYPKVISSIILQHHRDEETRPPLEDANTLKVLACVDLSNTICKMLGAGYREPRENFDLVGHPAFGFLDIPSERASELVTELQDSFAKEAAYWVH
ncbi:MAG: HDOD domain-containing protein [Acidobacteria bacterium]|nr:HDOD domain-containing protein [Acidobacteriota bacterium]